MEQDQVMTVADLSVKFKSKIELYNVLVREGNIYLPKTRCNTEVFKRNHDEKEAICWMKQC